MTYKVSIECDTADEVGHVVKVLTDNNVPVPSIFGTEYTGPLEGEEWPNVP
jgi:FAD/FMN-containing dehydrogenase